MAPSVVTGVGEQFIKPYINELSAGIWVECIIIKYLNTTMSQRIAACGTFPVSCFNVVGSAIHVEMYDPKEVNTPRAMMFKNGVAVADYNISILRDDGVLVACGLTQKIPNRTTVALTSKKLSANQLNKALEHIGSHRRVMPARMWI